jgi:hypothetical protein
MQQGEGMNKVDFRALHAVKNLKLIKKFLNCIYISLINFYKIILYTKNSPIR